MPLWTTWASPKAGFLQSGWVIGLLCFLKPVFQERECGGLGTNENKCTHPPTCLFTSILQQDGEDEGPNAQLSPAVICDGWSQSGVSAACCSTQSLQRVSVLECMSYLTQPERQKNDRAREWGCCAGNTLTMQMNLRVFQTNRMRGTKEEICAGNILFAESSVVWLDFEWVRSYQCSCSNRQGQFCFLWQFYLHKVWQWSTFFFFPPEGSTLGLRKISQHKLQLHFQ